MEFKFSSSLSMQKQMRKIEVEGRGLLFYWVAGAAGIY